jgi:hypothetical protein
MPKRKPPQTTRSPAALAASPHAEQSNGHANGKWADPYRPLVTDQAAGFEMGENKLANQMVFNFAKDPGTQVKERLKHYGYHYHVGLKTWTVNATPVTREIAGRLAVEFAGEEKAMSR